MNLDRRLKVLEDALDEESEWRGLPLMMSHDLDSDTYHVPGEAPPMTPAEFDEWRAGLEPGRIVIVVNQPKREPKA